MQIQPHGMRQPEIEFFSRADDAAGHADADQHLPDNRHLFDDDDSVYIHSNTGVRANMETLVLTHPFAAMSVGFVIFIAAVLFPKAVYSNLLGDDCHMFLNGPLIGFNCCCAFMAALGVWFGQGGGFEISRPRWYSGTPYRDVPLALGGALAVLILMNVGSFVTFAQAGGLSGLASALSGQSLMKTNMRDMADETEGQLWKSLLVLSSVLAPAMWHMTRSFPKGGWIRMLFVLFAGTYSIAALLAAKRNFLTRPMFGVLLLFLVWPTLRSLSRGRAIFICLLLAIFVVFAFLGLSVVREGVHGGQEATAEILRYVIGPYNAEALIVTEEMVVPGSGKGYYWMQWAWNFPIVEQVFDLDRLQIRLLGEAPPYGHAERGGMVSSHGISTGTALPAFACSYVDFGWFGVFPFFIVGFISIRLWQSMLDQKLAGLIFYPLCAYSFVEWRGNLIFPSVLMSYGLLFFMLMTAAIWIERLPSQRLQR